MRIVKPVIAAFIILVLVASKCKPGPITIEDNYIQDELLVQVKNKGEIEMVTSELYDYGAFIKAEISPSANLYLIKYDPDLISPEEMYEKVYMMKIVETVQFNRTVEKDE